MSTNTTTTNIPDPRFADAPRIDFHGIPDESNIDAFERFLAVLIILAYKSQRGPIVLRVHNCNADHAYHPARGLVTLLTLWSKQAFSRLVAGFAEGLPAAHHIIDAIVYENVAVHIADGDNPRWIVLAGLAG